MEAKLVFVALTTCFFSFGVQTLFYFWYLLRRERIIDKYKTVFSYYSGFIGDAILIPATNIFAVDALRHLNYPFFDYLVWIVSLCIGLITSLIFHLGQKYYNLTNWTMPQRGKWTLLGVYHSLFMFGESTFLVFTLMSFLKRLVLEGRETLAGSPVQLGLFIMFLFFVTFVYDYWKPLFRKYFLK